MKESSNIRKDVGNGSSFVPFLGNLGNGENYETKYANLKQNIFKLAKTLDNLEKEIDSLKNPLNPNNSNVQFNYNRWSERCHSTIKYHEELGELSIRLENARMQVTNGVNGISRIIKPEIPLPDVIIDKSKQREEYYHKLINKLNPFMLELMGKKDELNNVLTNYQNKDNKELVKELNHSLKKYPLETVNSLLLSSNSIPYIKNILLNHSTYGDAFNISPKECTYSQLIEINAKVEKYKKSGLYPSELKNLFVEIEKYPQAVKSEIYHSTLDANDIQAFLKTAKEYENKYKQVMEQNFSFKETFTLSQLQHLHLLKNNLEGKVLTPSETKVELEKADERIKNLEVRNKKELQNQMQIGAKLDKAVSELKSLSNSWFSCCYPKRQIELQQNIEKIREEKLAVDKKTYDIESRLNRATYIFNVIEKANAFTSKLIPKEKSNNPVLSRENISRNIA